MVKEILAAVALVSSGLDCYVTYSRISKYGPSVELNPLVRFLAAKKGVKIATLVLGVQNLVLTLGLAAWNTVAIGVFAGVKAGLAAMQFKASNIEAAVERIVNSAKSKL